MVPLEEMPPEPTWTEGSSSVDATSGRADNQRYGQRGKKPGRNWRPAVRPEHCDSPTRLTSVMFQLLTNPPKCTMKISNLKTRLPQAGRVKDSKSCTAKAVCPTDSGGGGRKSGKPKRKKKDEEETEKKLLIATYNVHTMRKEEYLNALEEKLRHINWSVLGISETRLASEATIILKSGHVLFQRNADITRMGGAVAF